MPTADEVRRANMATLAGVHANYVEAVRKAFGDEGLEIIGNANRESGLKIGEAAIEQGQLKKGNLKSIFDFFVTSSPFFGFKLNLQSVSNDELQIIVTECPWLETFKQTAQDDICEWVCKIDEGIGQAVDPNLHLGLESCMMRGDDYCVYRFYRVAK